MTRKLTIVVEDDVYRGLHSVVGKQRISRFLNDLARPHVMQSGLAQGYRDMAADADRERDACDWIEGVTGDVPHDPG